jgi:putative PIN family toxin of toxin-antitoxin system
VKAVLDTNVIVSGIFFGGVPRAILEAWEAGRFELILSPGIFGEYLDTCEELATSRPNLRFRAILLRLIGEGTLVPDVDSEEGITRDPDDDKFMLTARESGADVVSGDRDLHDVSGWAGARVYTPRDFLNHLDAARG